LQKIDSEIKKLFISTKEQTDVLKTL